MLFSPRREVGMIRGRRRRPGGVYLLSSSTTALSAPPIPAPSTGPQGVPLLGGADQDEASGKVVQPDTKPIPS